MKAVLLFLLALTASAQTFVNNQGSGHQNSPHSFSYAGSVGAGHLLIACIMAENATVVSVTSPIGNTWVKAIGQVIFGVHGMEIWYALNSVAGTESPTITSTSSGQPIEVLLSEYSGVATTSALDKTAAAANASSSGSVTTTAANELLFGYYVSNGTNPTAGSGYTIRNSFTTDLTNVNEDQTVSATGSYAATFTVGTGTTNVMLATFKAPSSSSFSSSQPVIIY